MSRQIKLGLAYAAKFTKKAFDSTFLFLPFTSLHPLGIYLSLATSVIIHRDRSILGKGLLLFFILFADFFINVYLSLFLPLNPLDRIRLADFVYINTGEDFIYGIGLLLKALLHYVIYLLLTVKPVFLGFLENLLFSKAQPLLKGISQKSPSPQKNCKQSALWCINLLGTLKILCDILFLIVCATIVNEAINNPADLLGNPLVSPFLFTWRILQVTLGLTGLFVALFHYATIFPNVAAVVCAALTLLFHRLQLNAKQLTDWKASFGSRFTWSPFSRYRAYSLETLSLLFIANEVLGRIFVAFMAVNSPLSAYSFVFLTLGDKNLKAKLCIILVMVQGLVCTLPIHWLLARLTKRLHAPSKSLFTLSSLTNHRVGNFRARLTLHLAIYHLHTNQKYGFTYGSFGLVTMSSFCKGMLIYCKFIIYSYKLINSR